MTEAERQAVIFSAFAAIRRLVPRRFREDLDQHLTAATAAFNAHVAEAYEKGMAEATSAVEEAAYERGKADGMIAVQKRSDWRDLEDVGDPIELRSVH